MPAWSRASSGCCTSSSGWTGASATTMKNRHAPPGWPPAIPAKGSRISSPASHQTESDAPALIVVPGLVPGIHVDPRDKPGGDELEVRVIGHHDFFAGSIEYGAAQLAAVALVARFAGGARVDHQYLADATNQLVVGVAVQHKIRFCLAEPRQQGIVRVDVSPLRLPGGRVDEQQLLSTDLEFEPFGPLGEPLEVRPVDPVGLTGAGAVWAEEALLVVAKDRVGAALSEQANDLVREAVLVNAVAEADQLVDIPEYFQCMHQAGVVAMQVGDNADLQEWLRRAMMFMGFRLITTFPSWFSTSIRVRTMPRSGFERDGVASSTVTRMRNKSPGRTGCSQRSSSMPGEARLAAFGRKLSARSRIIMAPVCQPLAIRPPKRPRRAASGSRCMSCGSKRLANSMISAPSTRISPYSNTAPGM